MSAALGFTGKHAELVGEGGIDQLPILRGEPEEPITGHGSDLQQDVPVPVAVDLQQHPYPH